MSKVDIQKTDFHLSVKTPQLLFESACIVDDDPHKMATRWLDYTDQSSYQTIVPIHLSKAKPQRAADFISEEYVPYSYSLLRDEIRRVYPLHAQ